MEKINLKLINKQKKVCWTLFFIDESGKINRIKTKNPKVKILMV